MQAYSKYKEPSLPDLFFIPAHWEEKRMKLSFTEIDERSTTGDEEMLSVSHITGITPRSQKNVNMFVAESNVGLKICTPGDIVINTMWAWMAALGVSKYNGIVSPSYGVYHPKGQDYNPEYLDFLLRTEIYRAEYIRRSTGINTSRLRLYPDRFLDMRFICPPREEQDQIVRFLDWKVSRINKLINSIRKRIQLFLEMKQTIIDRVMTQGATPYVQKKNSNCSFINKIPETWEIKRLKNVADIYTGNSISDSEKTKYENDTHAFPYISSKDITQETGMVDYQNGMYTPIADDKFRIAPKNSTLVCIEGGSAGRKVAYLKTDVSFVNKLCCFTGKNIHPKYFNFYFQTSYFYSEFQKHLTGLIGGVSQSELKRLSILTPPKEEQHKIVAFLDENCSSLNKLLTKTRSLIQLLEEYRARLISDAVTGKIDVRNIVVPEYEKIKDISLDDNEEIEDKTMKEVVE